jgi:hypothetical protein
MSTGGLQNIRIATLPYRGQATLEGVYSYSCTKTPGLHLKICKRRSKGLTSGAHAETNAHGRDQDTAIPAAKLRQTSGNLSYTGCEAMRNRAQGAEGRTATVRVAESDSAAVDVDFLDVEAEFPDTVDVHRSEGLVDLEEVDVVDGQAAPSQDFGNSESWSDAPARRSAA